MPTTRSTANNQNQGLGDQVAELMARLSAMEMRANEHEDVVQRKDGEIRRLRENTAMTVPTSACVTSAPGVKPTSFKGDKHDGAARNLNRFLHRRDADSTIFPAYFPTDAVKAAYAMTG